MKQSITKITALAGMAAMIWACSPGIEEVPLERFTEEYLWDSQDSLGTNASNFLTHLYTFTPNGFNRIESDFLDAASDDAISSSTGNPAVQRMATGGITKFYNPDNAWGNSYAGIRKATIFLNNIDKVPLAARLPNGEPMRPAWKAEARFLRALFYFELVKRYGGVPLLGDQVRGLNDDLELPRNTFAECIQYIVAECDLAAEDLRPDPATGIDAGRATQGGALALKARALLYAASPLYNGGNVAPGNALTGYAEFSPERWKQAADAARDLMDRNDFQLLPNFKNVFTLYTNSEVIFARQGGNSTNVEKDNAPIGFTGTNNGRTSPTQELVDAYGMANGLPITDPASGYNENNPYANRDPRLTATIFYNGARWLNRNVETFEGGLNRPGGTPQQTRTGYYLRKFMGNFENSTGYSDVNRNFILFRYAEVLLNFAEARNEYLAAPGTEVKAAVEQIRQRAGLVPYQLPASLTKDQMREIIRQERRKELAFEEHRFWDIRRWKIAENLLGKPLHGVNIQRVGDRLVYEQVGVINPVFSAPKMYLYPIPYEEVVKNGNMRQNPGW